MMELIATVIFIGSLLGIGVVLARKVPELENLPEIKEKPLKESLERFVLRIKNFKCFQPGFWEVCLQRLLSGIKVLALKIESKCSDYLQKLREKSAQRKKVENDNYWQELKKSVDSEKK